MAGQGARWHDGSEEAKTIVIDAGVPLSAGRVDGVENVMGVVPGCIAVGLDGRMRRSEGKSRRESESPTEDERHDCWSILTMMLLAAI